MTEPSALEKVTSSLPVKVAANVFSILGATVTPSAQIVPVLLESLASGRQAQRFESTISELRASIEQNDSKLKDMTDDQYKVVNEAISAALYTINQEKMLLLKRAAANALLEPDAVAECSDSLSRVIRDISATEAAFIVRNFSYEMIMVTDDMIESPKTLAVKPDSTDEIILSGLINLGLLYSKGTYWDTIAYEWSPLVVKLIRLIREK